MKHTTLCFSDFLMKKKTFSFAAVVLNGRSPGQADFRLKKKMDPCYDYHVVGTIHNFGVFKNSGKKVILQVFVI